MTSNREVGFDRFSNKSLTSSCSSHWNALINTLLSQSTLFARSQNFAAYVEAARDFC